MDSPIDENQNLGYFKVWLLITQLLGVVSIALVSSWCDQYLGGFAWQSNPQLQFNHHPFFMVLGFVFCYGNGLLVFRVFRYQRKQPVKLLHFGLHTVAFIFTIVSLKAVFDSHNLPAKPKPNLYSLHSWLGLTAVILFAMQYTFGFLAFLSPGLTKIWRTKYLPLHVFFGLSIFIMGVAASLIGIAEMLIYVSPGGYGSLPTTAVIGNLLGYCLILFAIFIGYLVVTPEFKRRLLPEEVQLQLEQNPN
uniref:Cytochrome b561 n=1 Tax=Parasteatoda tepidariorum TaxID=114398 RepID=A0A2L2YJK4_PARTP